MRSPFPGMDPWLEDPAVWPDVHNRFIATIADALTAQLPGRYYVSLEERTVITDPDESPKHGRPDLAVVSPRPVEPLPPGPFDAAPMDDGGLLVLDVDLPDEEPTRETFLEVRDADRGRLITVIEVLSPSNKARGRTRRQYRAKRRKILGTRTNLIEIDLLRDGDPLPPADVPEARSAAYRIVVFRGRLRPRARIFAFTVRTPIPDVIVPLRRDDPEPVLPLNPMLHELYERARYSMRVRYDAPPRHPLSEADAAWARERVALER